MNRETVVDEQRHSSFGNTLRRLREAAALSQEELAERAGLSVRGVSDLERGARTTPRLETVRMLADGLELDDLQRSALLAVRNLTDEARHAPPHHKIPNPPTSLIGRAGEVADILAALNDRATRLITLAGPGGVGKTRVAIEAARLMAATFAGEVVFVDLSAIRAPEMVIPAIADRLDIPDQAGREIRDVLAMVLETRTVFLVLDNLEQVVAAATDIAWLLTASPNLKVVVTSRILLRISAERVIPIEPLPLPTYHDVYALQQVEAVQLFAARAGAIDYAFVLDRDTAPVVAAIVDRLQGMPLAIELAAARVRALALLDLLKSLDSQLSFLVGGARDLPERHRTMRNTIAWSYDLLSNVEQSVFRFLSIFPDGCMLEMLLKVLDKASHLGGADVLGAVESLVNSSLVQRHDGDDGEVRYRMLQSVREFGLNQLSYTDEEPLVRWAAHSAWFVPLAHKVEYAREIPDVVFHMDRTESEYQNLREHLGWLIAHGNAKEALDISAALAFFRGVRNYYAEGRQELEALLAQPQNASPDIIRMRGLIGLGIILNQRSAGALARPFLEEGVHLARVLEERQYLSLALLSLGLSYFSQREIDDAERQFREGQDVAEAIGARFLMVANMHFLGQVAGMRGDLPRMKELLQEGLAICESDGLLWGVAISKINLAYVYIQENDLLRAETLALEAQELFFDIENRRDGTGVFSVLADIALRRGDLPNAEKLLRPALELARETGEMIHAAYCYRKLSEVAFRSGDLRSAVEHIREAIAWNERGNVKVEAILCLDDVARIEAATGNVLRACWCTGAVDSVLKRHGMARADTEAEDHDQRASAWEAQLGGDLWKECYERAASLSETEILLEYRSWSI